jgi:integrase
MSIYPRKDRNGEYWFRFRFKQGGKTTQYHRYGGATQRAAQVAERKLIGELEGARPGDPDNDLNEFILVHYWPAQKNHLTSDGMIRERGILNDHLGQYFAGPMSQINRQRIIAYIDYRKNGKGGKRKVGNETVRKELTILKHVLRIAVKLGMLSKNPFEELDKKDWPPKGQERTRHASGDEWPRLLREVPLVMRPAVIVLVNSGIRRGELMNLEHTDLDFERGVAYLPKTKNGKPRWFRLGPEIIELLKGLDVQQGNPKVFWQFTRNNLSVTVKRAVRRAGIQDFRLHDLRHTFATQVRQNGHGLDVIQKLLGHSDPRMTQRYAHLGDDLLNQAARFIS